MDSGRTGQQQTIRVKCRNPYQDSCYFALQTILKSKNISQKAKRTIYKTVFKPIITYASETWAITKKDVMLVGTWER
jgi:hypothetical protein